MGKLSTLANVNETGVISLTTCSALIVIMEEKKGIPDFQHTPPPPLKPFPYWPPQPTEEELKRNELMMEVNKWANNDDDIAQRAAETLILLLQKQFRIKPQKETVYVQE